MAGCDSTVQQQAQGQSNAEDLPSFTEASKEVFIGCGDPFVKHFLLAKVKQHSSRGLRVECVGFEQLFEVAQHCGECAELNFQQHVKAVV